MGFAWWFAGGRSPFVSEEERSATPGVNAADRGVRWTGAADPPVLGTNQTNNPTMPAPPEHFTPPALRVP
ncbi:hypothetical protein GCM10023319_66970 [Nocardia iowensis]